MLESNLWLSNARHANAMAQRLREQLALIPGIKFLAPTQANAVFAQLPKPAIDRLQGDGWRFYEFIAGGGCRFMCAWDTTEASVDAFAAAVAQALKAD
jgi:threonine aldolase